MSASIQLRFNKQPIENLQLPTLRARATFHDTVVSGLRLRVTSRGIAKQLADWRGRPLSSVKRNCIEAKHRTLSKRSQSRANFVRRYLRALFRLPRNIGMHLARTSRSSTAS